MLKNSAKLFNNQYNRDRLFILNNSCITTMYQLDILDNVKSRTVKLTVMTYKDCIFF